MQSVMQQHCLYWDRDGDGIIWPQDTWLGFRELGFNVVFTFLAVVIIHSALSLPTRCACLPSSFGRTWANAHKGLRCLTSQTHFSVYMSITYTRRSTAPTQGCLIRTGGSPLPGLKTFGPRSDHLVLRDRGLSFFFF